MRSPESELDQLRAEKLYRERRFLSSPNGSRVRSGGAELLNFSSNDYLGLASHPDVIAAAGEAIGEFGGGTSASRLVYGGGPAHRRLEQATAAFFGTSDALTFANGYSAALGVLPAIANKNDTLILDKRCHASLIDGAKLSGATVRVFPHNGMEKLERLLRSSAESSQDDSRTIVVTESVFSMDGDLCPLADIVRLKNEFGALLLLDEAHALGVLGPDGRGLAHRDGLADQIDFLMATFGKSAGAAGGCVAGAEPWIELIANRARSFIYSTAPPAAQAAAAHAGLELIGSAEGKTLRAKLREHLEHFANALGIAPPDAAIVPIIIGEESAALRCAAELQEHGALVPAIRYPTVARGSARLRVTLSAAHSSDEVETLASLLRSSPHLSLRGHESARR